MSNLAIAYIVLTMGMFGFDLFERLYAEEKDWTAVAIGVVILSLGLAAFL